MDQNYEIQKSELDTRIQNLIEMGGDANIIFGYLNKALDAWFQNNHDLIPWVQD